MAKREMKESVRMDAVIGTVPDYTIGDGYKETATYTVGRSAAGAARDHGSAPAAFYAPKKRRSRVLLGIYAFTKRTFDIVSSLLFLFVFSWLYLVLADLVKCGDGA